MESLQSSEARDRWEAAWQLGYYGTLNDAESRLETEIALVNTLDDPDPRVRRVGLWALGVASSGLAATRYAMRLASAMEDLLRVAMERPSSTQVPLAYSNAVLQHFVRCASDPDPGVRVLALEHLLERRPSETTHDIFLNALTDEDPEARSVAILALFIGWKNQLPPNRVLATKRMIPQLQHPREEFRMLAAGALGWLGPHAAAAVPELVELLADPSADVRSSAASGLGRIGPAALSAEAGLMSLLADREPMLRMDAVRALGRIGSQASLTEILRLLEEDRSEMVVSACLEALGRIRTPDPRAISALMDQVQPATPTGQLAAAALSLTQVLDPEALGSLDVKGLIELMDIAEAISAICLACLAARVALARGDPDLARRALRELAFELEFPAYASFDVLAATVSSVGDLTGLAGLEENLTSVVPLLETLLSDPDLMPTREEELRQATVATLARIRAVGKQGRSEPMSRPPAC